MSKIRSLRFAICDLNGQPRGKRVPVSTAAALEAGTVHLPVAALTADIWGADVPPDPRRDPEPHEGRARITGRGPVPMPWLVTPSILVPVSLYREDGHPHAGDPRHALARILVALRRHGWQLRTGALIQFHLLDPKTLKPASDPQTGLAPTGQDMLSLSHLDAFDALISDIYEGADAMELPALTMASDGGAGQFSAEFAPVPALKAADDLWLFKQLVKGTARRHGMIASFMSKPFSSAPGNALRLHMSLHDGAGRNLFDETLPPPEDGLAGAARLGHAIGGCLAALPTSTAVFAPHATSYARLAEGGPTPSGIGWGQDNPTAALRVPGGDPAARRLEHRVPGADANPYLALAAIAGAMLKGIEFRLDPPASVPGNAHDAPLPPIPDDWDTAVALLEGDPLIAQILPQLLIRNLVRTKRQEMEKSEALSGVALHLGYLEAV